MEHYENAWNQIQVRYLKVWHWKGILDWVKTESSDVTIGLPAPAQYLEQRASGCTSD
jgi:hypothetical protein